MIYKEFPRRVEENAQFEAAFRTHEPFERLEATLLLPSDSKPQDFPPEGVKHHNDKRGFTVRHQFQQPGRVFMRFVATKAGTREVFDTFIDVDPSPAPPGNVEAPEPKTEGPAPAHLAALVQSPTTFASRDKRWAVITAMSQNVSYAKYEDFIDKVLCRCEGSPAMCRELKKLCELEGKEIDNWGRFYGTYTYEDLKQATEIFLLCNAHYRCNPEIEVDARLIYTDDAKKRFEAFQGLFDDPKAHDSLLKKAYAFLASQGRPTPFCNDMGLKLRCTDDMYLEYIWTFYHDIGMLEQTLKAISLRFQNKRTSLLKNQLEDLEISCLRPITDLLWGYINDEQHRLSVPRRIVEYDHQYGLAVTGKAAQGVQSIDRRSEFLSAFHTLLLRCHTFYTQTSNLTIRADPFPVQNALRELHKVLFDGAHNQFTRATFSSRAEFLIGQWLLGRPEVRLFLRGREMTPYVEKWMAPVDAMRRLQGWGEDSVATYRDLAVLGERILLSIRYGEWNDDNITEVDVRNWALSYKEDIQLYCHAYRSVTGVDLTIVDKLDTKQDTSQPVALIEARRKTLRAAG
jgi:hypothetical protein